MNGSHLFLEEVQELEAEVRGHQEGLEAGNGGEQHSGVIFLVYNEGVYTLSASSNK